MFQLNDKIKNLAPYDPVAGTYDIRLDANESFINPGSLFKKEIADAVAEVDFNRYPDPTCGALRQAFGKAYGVKSELVMAGNGSDEIITVLLGAFLKNGDKVAVLMPDFSMYGFYSEIYEKTLIKFDKGEDLSIDAGKLIADLAREKPQAVIFSNPCSPTSRILSREDVRKIIKSTDALVILDEAYMEFSDQSLMGEIEDFDNVVILKTCSKAWGLAAIRLGFAVSNHTIIDALNAVRSPYNVNSVTQAVGALMLGKQDYIEDAKKKLLKSCNDLFLALKILENQGITLVGNGGQSTEMTVKVLRVAKPETNFVLLELDAPEEAKIVYEWLLGKSIIVRVLGNCLRITAGSREENAALCEALGLKKNESI